MIEILDLLRKGVADLRAERYCKPIIDPPASASEDISCGPIVGKPGLSPLRPRSRSVEIIEEFRGPSSPS
jgi:hypothetical protein